SANRSLLLSAHAALDEPAGAADIVLDVAAGVATRLRQCDASVVAVARGIALSSVLGTPLLLRGRKACSPHAQGQRGGDGRNDKTHGISSSETSAGAPMRKMLAGEFPEIL